MVSAVQVPADMLINKLAKHLKESVNEITPHEWAFYSKTGTNRERPPETFDWWYIRAASILRRLYKDGPVGVERLRVYYGGSKRRGSMERVFKKGSGSIQRKIFQQLEKAGLVQKTVKGRILTAKGISLLDKIAYEVFQELLKDNPEIEKYRG